MSTAVEDWPRPHRITVHEYHRMAKVGLLAPDARVELIEGEIIDMPPIGSLHAGVVTLLTRSLILAVGEQALLRCQLPVRLNEWSEPQPDFALMKPRRDNYMRAQPIGPDTLLAIEVSDSTVSYDLRVKVPLYARHGVPEVWVVDLKRKRLHFFRSLENEAYTDATVAVEPGEVPIAMVPGAKVDFSWLSSLPN